MRFTITINIVLVSIGVVNAETSISPSNSHAYSFNTGWIDARGDVANGAVLGEYVCSGFLWGANVGWIDLGSGSPANGVYYQNNSASDFGVNHDGKGALRGFAYGANIGWIQFGQTGNPHIDLTTGQLKGHVWSANIGWIALSNSVAHVQTDFLLPGVDSDQDGLTDAWELSYTNSLPAFTAISDTDGDGMSDLEEHVADTSPLNAEDLLRITAFGVEFQGNSETDSVSWSSKPTRYYVLESRTVLNAGSPWADATSFIRPDAGTETTFSLPFPVSSSQRFLQVRAVKPLSP